jgi:hypothetical protein
MDLWREGRSLDNVIEGLPGWDVSTSSYDGDDAATVYDRILTMLRMYYSYSMPCVSWIGSTYYDLY